jgi:A/G-specific adenine glycosylase
MNPVDRFKATVYDHYAQCGRRFPWREQVSPWAVLVSELMLQQTQTERVVPFFERWMSRWPTPDALDNASLEDALREWAGLGYNRRCRFLKECAHIIVSEQGGRVPEVPDALRLLPGIGAYTAGAVACFSYNYPSVFIETNIRTALLYFFFKGQDAVPDTALFPLLETALDRENPRAWYWALMDYGASLKKTLVNPGRRSAHYARQSPFEGSFRQSRGRIIKTLLFEGSATLDSLKRRTGIPEDELDRALAALERDSMVAEDDGVYMVPNANTFT